MSRVEVSPISLPGDAVKFVKSWWTVNEGDPLWVPPLISERKAFFDPKKNPYHKHADIQCFMAYKDGRAVGTISAQVDKPYQDIEKGVGFFGFFEFVDDVEVAKALLDAAADWLRKKGMHEMRGPFNFNTNHEFGCLIDGFDTPPMIANPHNRAYYPRICEAIGLKKSKDWYAYWIDYADAPKNITAIAERFMSRHPNVTVRRLEMAHYDRDKALVHQIYEDAWTDNWGHTHMSKEEFDFMADGVKALLDTNLAWIALVDGEPAALAITLPDFNIVAKKMNGRIFPFGWWHFVFGRKKIDQLRVWILGVKRKFQNMPIGAPLYIKIWEEAHKLPIKGVEASLIYEDNHRMRGAMEKLGARIYKTYRIWAYKLSETAVRPEEEVVTDGPTVDGPTVDGPTADSATELLEVIPPHILNAKATIDEKPMADLSSDAPAAAEAAKQALDEHEK